MRYLHSFKIWLMTAVLMVACASVSFAGVQDFTLVNNTGRVIHQINVSASNSDYWYDDILGSDVLMNGDGTEVTFGDSDERYWDIRAIFDDGSDIYWQNIDLFNVIQVTLNSNGTASLDY